MQTKIESEAYLNALQRLRKVADEVEKQAFSMAPGSADFTAEFGRVKGLRQAEQLLWDLTQCR